MKKYFISLSILTAVAFSACVTPMPVTSQVDGSTSSNTGNARNWVLIMHGEACGSADEVASNMYVESSHETAIIIVTVDVSWTENGQPQHENKTLTVMPNSKTLIGCDRQNGIFRKMEIVNAQYNN